jgi:hypothetical protein
MPRAPNATRSHFAWLQDKLGCRSTWDRLGLKLFQINQRWPPFAKGSLSGSWTGFAALLAYGGHYRALAGDVTIPGDRPVELDSEKPYPACRSRRFRGEFVTAGSVRWSAVEVSLVVSWCRRERKTQRS